MAELEDKRIVLNEEIAKTSKPKHSFEEMFEHSMHFLSSPYEIWKNGSFEVKRTVIRLVFDGPLIVGANQELRTGKTTYPINMLGTLKGVNSKLVPRGSLEFTPLRVPVTGILSADSLSKTWGISRSLQGSTGTMCPTVCPTAY